MSISLNNIRRNKKYVLINHGEKFEFTVKEIQNEDEFLLKDLNSLEEYYMSELLAQGIGGDYSLWEL